MIKTKTLLLVILSCLSLNIHAQTDTIYKYYTKNWIECSKNLSFYYSKNFKFANVWHRQDFYLSNNQIQMDGYTADEAQTKRIGQYKYYDSSGNLTSLNEYDGYKLKSKILYYKNGQRKYFATYNSDEEIANEEHWLPDGSQKSGYIAYREATFKGGKKSFTSYMMRNLNREAPVHNGCPMGRYTVYLSFTIDSLGNIKDIVIDKNPGFGAADEAIRVIKGTDKMWLPAIDNNKLVDSVKHQTITFDVN